MLIWLLALLVFAVFGALGFLKGAVRMTIPLVGLFLGAALAMPLAPLLKPWVPSVGLTNPVWGILLPPLVVFFLVNLVFVIVGFFGHAKVNLFYKYRSDDVQRMSWERLNKRLGACVGLLAGAIYTVLIAWVVYVIGYLTVQVSPGESEASMARYLNQARVDLQSTGMEKVVAAIDGTPPWYYEASDLVGFLYHNPALYSRLAAYPPMIALAERPELSAIADDTDFQNMLSSQPSVAQVVENAHVQAVLGNAELMEQLRALDLKDLNQYLRTGVSEKFQDTPILGRWEIDAYLTFLLEKRRQREMTAADVRLLRYKMEFLRGFKLFIAADNTVRLKGPDISQQIGKLTELAKAVSEGARTRATTRVVAAPVEAPPPVQAVPQDAASRTQAERYGIRPGGGGASRGVPNATPGGAPAAGVPAPAMTLVTAQPAAPLMTTRELAAEIAKLPMVVLAEGNWREEGGAFLLSFKPSKEISQFVGTRSSTKVSASVREERLYVSEDIDKATQQMVLSRF